MIHDNIITPDKLQALATNLIARHTVDIVLHPNRNIFFIKPDFIDIFRTRVLPHINYKFVLITHDSDIPVNESSIQILDNPYLIKWFGMNCHIIHDKLYPIPIGIANEIYKHGNKDIILKIHNEKNKKNNLVYCNFDTNTDPNRPIALEYLKNITFIDIEKNKLPFEDYLRKLSHYKYVISPPGNSTDCHRIWEAMHVGTIPICLSSIPLLSFNDCPILFIQKWEDVTEELLHVNYDLIKSKSTIKSDFLLYQTLITEVAKIK